jgi:hypothetical protein
MKQNILSREIKLFKNISLSSNTMNERVNDLTVLKKKCKNFRRIELQLTRAQMLKVPHSVPFLIEELMGTSN